MRKTEQKYREDEELDLRGVRDEEAPLLSPYLRDAGSCFSL